MRRSGQCVAVMLATVVCIWLTSASIAKPVTFAELQGATIDTVNIYNIHSLRNGQERRYKARGTWKIVIGPGQSLRATLTRTAYDASRIYGSKTNSGTFTIGKSQKFIDGNTVWIFKDDALINLRTFQAGGIKITIKFSHRDRGFGCSIHAPMVREDGADKIRRDATSGQGNVQILSAKEESSRCRVSLH